MTPMSGAVGTLDARLAGLRPEAALSDLWRAPLHDFPLRDEVLFQFAAPAPETRVLEVGPGSGFTAFQIARLAREVTLVEVAGAAVERLRTAFAESPRVRCLLADASEPSLATRTGEGYDLAYLLDVFEYVPDPATCLQNLAAVLRPGGRLLLSYPNVPPPRGDGVTWFEDRRALEALVLRAGFAACDLFAVRLRPWPARLYHVAHEWPLRLYRWLRSGQPAGRPQTYETTWAFKHQSRLAHYRVLPHLAWAALGPLMRLTGPVFAREEVGDAILGRQIVIRALR